jgi:hypothetical protein
MSVTINAKGTSVSTFTVGKSGTSITQAGAITPPAASDLTVNLSSNRNLIVDAGISGPSLITTTDSLDLHINPATGGGQYLVLCANRWPTADGTANQTLTTNGSGVLSFTTLNRIGSPSLATTATSGFGYIPTTTGTPTGTPDAITGYAPMLVDTGGSKLWVYIGGTWKSTTLA